MTDTSAWNESSGTHKFPARKTFRLEGERKKSQRDLKQPSHKSSTEICTKISKYTFEKPQKYTWDNDCACLPAYRPTTLD